jgi:[protein-PII] uridylyltransferase
MMNARVKLAKSNLSDAVLDALWQRFEDEYFLRYSADEIAWHAEGILKTVESALPLIMIRHASIRGGTEIFIYQREHDRMFAHVTGTLEQLGLTIVDARILASKDGYALDTYVALDESGQPVTDQYRLNDLLKRLSTRLRDPQMELPKSLQQLTRQTKAFTVKTDVKFWVDANNQRTAMQVTTRDRPGLLSRIARALLDCNIQLQNAKVATYGERAEDIFFITDKDGAPIMDQVIHDQLRTTLIKYLSD